MPLALYSDTALRALLPPSNISRPPENNALLYAPAHVWQALYRLPCG